MRIIIGIFVCACFFIHTTRGASESDLRRELFNNYDKLVRPVKVVTTVVNVEIHLGLLVIKEVDTRKKTATFDSCLFLRWQDEFLRWDPQNYGGLTELIIPPTQVWTPDIGLYSGTPDINTFPPVLTNVIIYSNGTIIHELPFTVHTHCYEPQPTATTFHCRPVFGPWSYDVTLVDVHKYVTNVLQASKGIFNDINDEWTFESVTATRSVSFFEYVSRSYATVTFDTVFKRKQESDEDSDEDKSCESEDDESKSEDERSECKHSKERKKDKKGKKKDKKEKRKDSKEKKKDSKEKKKDSKESKED